MQFKRHLAKEIVATFVSREAAEKAADHFTKIHQKGEKPEEMVEVRVSGSTKLVDLLATTKLVSSKTDARRQIEQGGVKVNDVVVKDISLEVRAGDVIQKGKRHFVKLV